MTTVVTLSEFLSPNCSCAHYNSPPFSGCASNLHWGLLSKGYGRRKSSSRVQGEVQVGGLGDEALLKLKQFADTVYRFCLQKQSKCENSHMIDPLILSVSQWGLSDILRGLAPKPMSGASTAVTVLLQIQLTHIMLHSKLCKRVK